ncbi:MAG: MFS transporter [Chloroflexota bacterium]|nr:MFS transporter [Chloroflexota bacterium]MDE2958690.1 MFS transporter [Chloroflexota bacterium]
MQHPDTARPTAEPAPAFGGRIIVPGLATGHVVFHWIVQSFVVVLPEIQQAFQLNTVGVGGILSARELASGLVALPGGVVVDILRRYWAQLLASCLAVSALGCLAMGVSPVYPLLLIGMAVVAISHSIWHLPASASLSHHFPERRGVVLAAHGVGGSVGDVVGPVATGALLAFLTWRELLSVYAVVPFFLAACAVWSLRNIGRGRDEPRVELADRVEATGQLLRNPVLWGLTAVRGFRGMALVALVTILPLYLSNDLDMGPANRGFHIGLLIAVGLVAKPAAGMLSDRFGRKQVLVPGLAWSCLAALALTIFDTGVPLTITIALLGLFLYPDQPILVATVFDVIGRDVATTGLGMVASIAFLMSVFSPLIAGALYESLGFEAAVYYIAALFVVAAVVFVALPLSPRPSEPSAE